MASDDISMSIAIASSRRSSPNRPAQRVERRGGQKRGERTRGKQAEGDKRRTKARRSPHRAGRRNGGTAGQVKQDKNMRQRIRHEQVIGTASSGIEHEMTREWGPAPAYRRNSRRFIKLTAHITAANPTEKDKPHARTRTPQQTR